MCKFLKNGECYQEYYTCLVDLTEAKFLLKREYGVAVFSKQVTSSELETIINDRKVSDGFLCRQITIENTSPTTYVFEKSFLEEVLVGNHEVSKSLLVHMDKMGFSWSSEPLLNKSLLLMDVMNELSPSALLIPPGDSKSMLLFTRHEDSVPGRIYSLEAESKVISFRIPAPN